MYYAIDFDSLSVESKTDNREDLTKYVVDNNLSLAIAIVDSEDELSLQFTLDEMKELYSNIDPLTNRMPEMEDEDTSAKLCWSKLNRHQDEFPRFKKSKGKKPILEASKKSSDTTAVSKENKKPTNSRVKLDNNDTIYVLKSKCRKGSILNTIVVGIDEDLCDTVGELIEYITENHIIPKTGELADVKFAEHNIKYFIKKGAISIGANL